MRIFLVAACLIAMACLDSSVLAMPAVYNMWDLRMSQPNQSPVDDVEWTDLSMARGRSMGASPCTCEGKVCGCCQSVKIPKLGIDTKACANVTFLSSQIGASFTLTFNGKVVFKKTVSVKNPDPVCVKFSNKFGAEICGELYKLSVSPSGFEGCVRLEGKLLGKTVATIELGCFKMSFKTGAQDYVPAVPLSLASKSIAEWTDVAPMAPADNGDCSCSAEQCQCCQHIQIKELKLDNDVCVQVEFLSTSLGVSVSLTIDGKVIFKKTLSVQDPSPLCLPFEGGKLCVELYNLALTPTDFSGCGRLEAEFFGRVVAKVDLGCFRIPLRLAANEQIKEVALSRGRMSQMSLKEAMVGQPAAQVSQPRAGHAPASLPMTILLDRDMSNEVKED